MRKKRLSLWKQQQHGARNTCQLILSNKRDLRMAEVLYLVSMSTSYTAVQSLMFSVSSHGLQVLVTLSKL